MLLIQLSIIETTSNNLKSNREFNFKSAFHYKFRHFTSQIITWIVLYSEQLLIHWRLRWKKGVGYFTQKWTLSETDTRQSLANEPQVQDGCFVLEGAVFLESTAWLTRSWKAKLTADLNHDLRTKTNLGDSSRVKGLMMPNLLPGAALQAVTILVAMEKKKNFWRPKFWRKSGDGDHFTVKGH